MNRQIGEASSTQNTLLHNIYKQIKRLAEVIYTSLSSKQDINTRVYSIASTATATPDTDNYDMIVITAQSEALIIGAPTGTPHQGNVFALRIKDNGTARAISFNGIYQAVGVTLPTTTVLGKILYIAFIYNLEAVKYDVISVIQEA